MITSLLRSLLTLILIPLAAATVWCYALLKGGAKWPNGTITIQEQLDATGSPSGTLIDGKTSWNAAFDAALAAWNPNLARVQFAGVRNSPAAIGTPNGFSNIIFSSTN